MKRARPTHETSKRDLLNLRAVDLRAAVVGGVVFFCGTSKRHLLNLRAVDLRTAVLGGVVFFCVTSKLELSAFVQLSCFEGCRDGLLGLYVIFCGFLYGCRKARSFGFAVFCEQGRLWNGCAQLLLCLVLRCRVRAAVRFLIRQQASA